MPRRPILADEDALFRDDEDAVRRRPGPPVGLIVGIACGVVLFFLIGFTAMGWLRMARIAAPAVPVGPPVAVAAPVEAVEAPLLEMDPFELPAPLIEVDPERLPAPEAEVEGKAEADAELLPPPQVER
jgi:hypothetical protein